MPDQEMIRNALTRARFRTKIDLSDAYKQIRVNPEHVSRTVFETPFGNMISLVMQQGDKNGPPTFQQLIMIIFADMIRIFVYCYQDDIFVFSMTWEDHQAHLRRVFQRLREEGLFLSRNPAKVDIYSARTDCLGFIVTDKGIHVDLSKIDKIIQWRHPRNFNDVQKFNGMIQYLSQFLKDVTVYTAPLMSMCSNGKEFVWGDLQEKCFHELKQLVVRAPIIKPIDHRKDEPIWVIMDASARGVGGYYGQGPDWQTCRPAGFMSWKFTSAQFNYATWEHELLAVLEALLRWEDKLLSLQFTIVTDHKALMFFKEMPYMTQRQMRWWEYLSRFEYKIEYIKGDSNKVADSLSRYYMSDSPSEQHDISEYVNADSRLDPDGDDLPKLRAEELLCMRIVVQSAELGAKEVHDRMEPRNTEAMELKRNKEAPVTHWDVNEHPKIKLALSNLEKLYIEDRFFTDIWKNTDRHNRFEKERNLLWTHNRLQQRVICVPKGISNGQSVRGILIDTSHETIGHLGYQKTLEYTWRWFWWPSISEDMDSFCK
jgi:hypothetical protein